MKPQENRAKKERAQERGEKNPARAITRSHNRGYAAVARATVRILDNAKKLAKMTVAEGQNLPAGQGWEYG